MSCALKTRFSAPDIHWLCVEEARSLCEEGLMTQNKSTSTKHLCCRAPSKSPVVDQIARSIRHGFPQVSYASTSRIHCYMKVKTLPCYHRSPVLPGNEPYLNTCGYDSDKQHLSPEQTINFHAENSEIVERKVSTRRQLSNCCWQRGSPPAAHDDKLFPAQNQGRKTSTNLRSNAVITYSANTPYHRAHKMRACSSVRRKPGIHEQRTSGRGVTGSTVLVDLPYKPSQDSGKRGAYSSSGLVWQRAKLLPRQEVKFMCSSSVNRFKWNITPFSALSPRSMEQQRANLVIEENMRDICRNECHPRPSYLQSHQALKRARKLESHSPTPLWERSSYVAKICKFLVPVRLRDSWLKPRLRVSLHSGRRMWLFSESFLQGRVVHHTQDGVVCTVLGNHISLMGDVCSRHHHDHKDVPGNWNMYSSTMSVGSWL